MRKYSRRERVAFGLLAVVFLLAAIIVTAMLIAVPESRTFSWLLSAFGAWAGTILFAKIALTGTSTAFFERSASKALGLDSSEEDKRS